jgi:hypothetical protein
MPEKVVFMAVYFYTAFGLCFATEFPCPELAPGRGSPDVLIRYGVVPTTLAVAKKSGVCYQAAPGQLLLTVDGVARFMVQDGAEIIVERAPECDDDSLRLFLLGSVIGALLQQRGTLTLHSSVIEVDDGCVGFLGHSGVGKSTQAAALLHRGYRLLTDDVCAITLAPNATPLVHPGYPQMKLWADTLTKLAMSPETLRPVRPQLGKHAWTVATAFCPETRPLRRLYALDTTNTADLTVQAVERGEKFQVLKNHTYRALFLDGLDGRVPHFHVCATVAQRVPVYRIIRPMYPFLLDELVTRLEQEWAT